MNLIVQTMKAAARAAIDRITQALSKRWIGPLISLVVLTVSVVSLVFSVATFLRQGQRWAAEDVRIGPQVYFVLERGVRSDDWQRGVLQVTNRLDVQLQVLKVQIVDSSRLQITEEYVSNADSADRHPILEKAADHLDFDRIVSAYNPKGSGETWGTGFFIKPAFAAGAEIVMRFVMREVPYPHREWIREASAIVLSPEQGDRLTAEDARIGPEVSFVLDKGISPDGWRRGVLQVTNRLDAQLQVLRVEVADLRITEESVSTNSADRHPVLEKAADHLDFDRTMVSGGKTWGAPFFIKTARSSGAEIVMRFVMREVPYPNREWIRRAAAIVPSP